MVPRRIAQVPSRSRPRVPEVSPTPPPAPAPAPASAPAPAPQPAAAAIAQAAPAVVPQSAPAQATSPAINNASALPAASAEGLPRGATPAVPTASNTAPRNDMMVLNASGRKGLWAYYAEDYARLRGCAIGDRGATLLQETIRLRTARGRLRRRRQYARQVPGRRLRRSAVIGCLAAAITQTLRLGGIPRLTDADASLARPARCRRET